MSTCLIDVIWKVTLQQYFSTHGWNLLKFQALFMWNMYNFHCIHFCELTYIKLNIFSVEYVLSSSVGLTLCDPMDCSPPGLSVHRFASRNTGMSCHFPLVRIFKTQGLNPCLLHEQMDTLPLSHLGNPHIVKRSLQTDYSLCI